MTEIFPYKNKMPKIGERVFLAPGVKLIGDVEIGDDSSIFYNCVLRADINSIKIGKRTNIQDNSTIHLSDDYGVEIGNDVIVGHAAIIHACKIGNNVTIGMGAIVMDGAEISDNSIVAAGALVTPGKKFPPGVLIVGSPAVVKKELSTKQMEGNIKMADKYCKVKDELIKVHSNI